MQPVKRTRDGRTESSGVSELPPNGFGVVEPQEVTHCVVPSDPGAAEMQLVTFKFHQVFILKIQKREVEIQKRWMQVGEINLSTSA